MEVKISVVIITLNEEKNIGRCIDSVMDIADDIVVVDSYSTDKTEKICNDKGIRFIKHVFHSYIDQKNWAITQAKHPYILSLDADEALSEAAKSSLMKVEKNWKYDGYIFNRLTNYCGKWIKYTNWYPSRKLRLWDSRKGEWGGINPHDKFNMYSGSTQKRLKGDILHYSYYNLNEHIQQSERFSTIQAQAYYNLGVRTNLFDRWIHVGWRFFYDYILRLGFLDGKYGFIISKLSARTVNLKYIKLSKLQKQGGSLRK